MTLQAFCDAGLMVSSSHPQLCQLLLLCTRSAVVSKHVPGTLPYHRQDRPPSAYLIVPLHDGDASFYQVLQLCVYMHRLCTRATLGRTMSRSCACSAPRSRQPWRWGRPGSGCACHVSASSHNVCASAYAIVAGRAFPVQLPHVFLTAAVLLFSQGDWTGRQCMCRVLGHSACMPSHGGTERDMGLTMGLTARRCMAGSRAGRSTPSACCSAAPTRALRRSWTS